MGDARTANMDATSRVEIAEKALAAEKTQHQDGQTSTDGAEMQEQIDALQAELRTKEEAANVLVEKLTKEKADIDTHSVSIIEGLQKQVKELQAKVASSEKPTVLGSVKVKTEPKDDDSSVQAVQKSTPAQQKRVADLEAKVA